MPRRDDAIYDADKIAKFFGVTRRTVQGWCKGHKLPAFKIGKDWKVRVSDLQKVIDQKVHSHEEKTSRLL